ncbi:DNA-processing protein DprA [Nocardioides panaciterrulae]|uniref:DNA processing protein n=1 Tax=Nocardioides panaciterrulae TaxID=661492 RepID=A0A7Y9JBI3_9ACTN|nr:DNA-processing protein DprA [Nocardioides panaciterrulae]NYD42413.1 DNA processing protein [Nocardioides panaciterrulae]
MSAPEAERLARAALSRLIEPGTLKHLCLVDQLGAQALYEGLLAESEMDDLRNDVSARLAGIDPARELEQAAARGVRFVVPGDDEWPAVLQDLAGADPVQERGGVPVGLWVQGPMRLDELAGSVAVVGSRSATTYGTATARDLAGRVGHAGRVVVSGAAFGIDQAAHRGAIAAGGRSLAVLACGADRVYPQGHRDLVEHLAQEHAVVSETPPGGSPTRLRFLSRNRLIAALTAGTVVVEAAARSGALNTANWATRLNRVLMGVPGPVTSAPSEGVHELIRVGAATLVTGAADVLELLGVSGEHLVEPPRGRARPRDRISVRQQQVLDAVPVRQAAGVDSIARAAGVGIVEASTVLHALLRQGLVEQAGPGWRLAAHALT